MCQRDLDTKLKYFLITHIKRSVIFFYYKAHTYQNSKFTQPILLLVGESIHYASHYASHYTSHYSSHYSSHYPSHYSNYYTSHYPSHYPS